MGVELPLRVVVTILECCVTFSGVKLSIRSFVLLLMLENDIYIAEIGQAVLELLSFKVESGNHQRGISLLQEFSDIFGNMRLVPLKMTSHLTSHNLQILKIEIFSKLCKI